LGVYVRYPIGRIRCIKVIRNGVNNTMPEQKLLSVPEVAGVLGICERSVWNMLIKREMGSVIVGRLRRVHKKELDRFIEQRTIPPKH